MLLPIIPAILLIAVLAGVSSIQTVHAAPVGLVCLHDASGAAAPPANPCSPTPITFDGPNPSTPQISPTQIRVGVYINGSDAINGFDISLLVNHLFLTPAGFDLTGSVLPTPTTIILECRQNVLIQGSVCAPTDSIDTYHLVIVGALGQTTASPTSGLLFTAIFNVVGTTTASGISVGFQTGCTSTSVAGGVCVTISNGTNTAVPETMQSGTLFSNLVNPPFVAITSSASSVSALRGAAGPSATITATAEGGFPAGSGCGGFGCAVDSVAFSAVATSGFTAPTFSVASCVTGGTTCTTVVTFNTATAGTYSATVFGTYVSDSGTIGITLTGVVTITVNIEDVAFTVNGAAFAGAQTVYMAKTGASPLFLVTAQSLGGYTGTITYTVTVGAGATSGLTATNFVLPAPFPLAGGATVTTGINVTSAPNLGLASVRITQSATGLAVKNSPGTGGHTVKVSGFSVVTNSTSMTFTSGGSATVSDTWTSLGNPPATNGFAGALAISNTITGPTGTGQLAATCTTPVTLVAGGSAAGTCKFSGTLAGSYTVAITGTGGTNNDMTNSTNVAVTINPSGPAPGINLSASPTSITVNSGTSAT